METKECKRCRIDKELDEFFDPSNQMCKECNVERWAKLKKYGEEKQNAKAYADYIMFDVKPEDY